jgi:hypothetical protein
MMAAPKGNKFWEARSSHGRNPKFDKPETLWEACLEYFGWVENNPLYEMKAFHASGKVVTKELPKMRAMTIGGLCIFLDMSRETWFSYYSKKEGFIDITKKVEDIIRDQKFSGAAADLLNPNIIARDLGLRDKTETEHTGKNGGPIEFLESIKPTKGPPSERD